MYHVKYIFFHIHAFTHSHIYLIKGQHTLLLEPICFKAEPYFYDLNLMAGRVSQEAVFLHYFYVMRVETLSKTFTSNTGC